MKPYPVQLEMIEAALAQYDQGVRGTLVVAATGTGKTVIASHVIDRRRHLGRALFLAHEDRLLKQAAEKIHTVTGLRPDVEKAERYASALMKSSTVVASVQTLNSGNGKRMRRLDPNEFGVVVIDEAHRAHAKTYWRVYDWFSKNPNLVFLLITATLPTDKRKLSKIKRVAETIAYTYDIKQGVDDGYLVPIKQRYVPINNLDYSVVKTVSGDFNQKQLGEVLEDDEIVGRMVLGIKQFAWDRKTLIFSQTIDQGYSLMNALNKEEQGCAAMVTGKTDDDKRDEVIEAFAKGKIRFLINMSVYVEGFDEPGIETVVMCRPTKSLGRYKQMLGRGTRPVDTSLYGMATAEERRAVIAASAKPYVEIIDFTGNCGSHKLITAVQALGDIEPAQAEQVEAEVRQVLEESEEAVDVQQAIEEAKQRIEEREEAKRRAEQEKWKNRQIEGRELASQEIDPFDSKSKPMAQLQPGVSAKQVQYLIDHGLKNAASYTRGQVNQAINMIAERREQGLCSIKQALLLQKRAGFSREECRTLSKEDAGYWIQKIKANGWKPIKRETQEVA